MTKRWVRRPQGSTWGDWGEDDQLGRLNLIGPSQVLKAVAEVKTGRTFCLSLPLNLPGGSVLSPVRSPQDAAGSAQWSTLFQLRVARN